MDEAKTKDVVGEPDGWTPITELEHFMRCPVCGETLDCRDLGRALKHWHDGPPPGLIGASTPLKGGDR